MNEGFWVKALEIASKIHDPIAAAVFMGVFAVLLAISLRNKRPAVVITLPVVIFALGFSPIAASMILKLQGVYHVQIVVLDVSGQPTGDAEIRGSFGILPKHEPSNWEVDIAPQVRQNDGKVTFFASVKNSYLGGSSTVILGTDYFPQVKIQLRPLPTVVVRGVVELPTGRSVIGAHVSVVGYPDQATTDAMGDFALNSHAADGQMVTIRVEKGGLEGQYSGPAGRPLMVTISKP
jgi:hypothetical protein